MFLIIIILALSGYNTNSLAYDICTISHNSNSGILESGCGLLLDATNTIYLCDYNGDNCWIDKDVDK